MSDFALVMLAISLAMDAFAVSVCGGLALPSDKRTKGGLIFGTWFGGFQAIMPLLGYYAGYHFERFITNYDHWIAFGLLSYIGISMILESKKACVCKYDIMDNKKMLTLAVATSIDALAAGLIFVPFKDVVFKAVTMIGIVCFIFCFVGIYLGIRFGKNIQINMVLIGGLILIVIGIKILVEHLLSA